MTLLPLTIVLYLLGMYQEANNIQLLEALTEEEVDPFWKGLILLGWPVMELYKLALSLVEKDEENE